MNRTTILFRILAVLCWFCGFHVPNVVAQPHAPTKVKQDNCEMISGKLDAIGNKFPDLREGESQLIVLGGSPVGFSNRFDKVRIKNITKYLTKFYKIKGEQIVYGIGEPSEKFSYLRFYINGNLFLEMTLSPKSNLCTGMGESLPI